MTEEREKKAQALKKDLNQKKEILENVMEDIKKDKSHDSEKKMKLLENIEKNRAVMQRISDLIEKNREIKEE